MVNPEVLATALGLLGSLTLGASKYVHSVLKGRFEELEEEKADASVGRRLRELEDRHIETRRLAETAYASVHGSEDRPEDDGFIVETQERWDEMSGRIDRLSDSVDRLERSQESHQHKTEAVLDAVADEMDIDFVVPDGQGGDER